MRSIAVRKALRALELAASKRTNRAILQGYPMSDTESEAFQSIVKCNFHEKARPIPTALHSSDARARKLKTVMDERGPNWIGGTIGGVIGGASAEVAVRSGQTTLLDERTYQTCSTSA